MSKATQQFFENLKEGIEPAVQGVAAILAVAKEVGGAIWDGAQPAFEHGAHEAAALLFRGDAFVMYPHNQQGTEQTVEQGIPIEAMQQPEIERGGMEM